MSFFILIEYFRMLGTGRVNKTFSYGIFISKKMVTNMELDLTNVPFGYNSACVIQKFKRVVITVRLACIS